MSAPVLPDKQRSATAPVDAIASPTGAASPTAEQDSWEAAAPSPTAAAAAVDTASAADAGVAEHKAPAPSAVGLPVALKEDAPAAAPVTELPIPASSPVPDENIEMTEELKQELAEIAREEMEVGKKPPKKKNAAEEFKVRHQPAGLCQLLFDLRSKLTSRSMFRFGQVHDTREHLNIVFIGHVDAGKSTISGQILLLTGQVDEVCGTRDLWLRSFDIAYLGCRILAFVAYYPEV